MEFFVEELPDNREKIRLKRFAIQYRTRLFVVEYYRGEKIYRKNVRIKKKNVDLKVPLCFSIPILTHPPLLPCYIHLTNVNQLTFANIPTAISTHSYAQVITPIIDACTIVYTNI